MEFQIDQACLEAIFEVPDIEGQFPPALRAYLRELGGRRPCVLLAFPPKSAGTFLRQAVIVATGGDLIRIVHAQGGRDAQPYLPTFIAYFLGGITRGPMIAHAHMQALPANIHFIEAFGLRPCIMLRSIPDMLASYWDMLDREPEARLQGLNCAIPAGWPDLADARKADFLVDILGPWYASYYATWLDYAGRAGNQACLLGYAELLADPAAALEKLLGHAGLPVAATDCQDIIGAIWPDRSSLRFNQGRQGRAAGYFGADHRSRLERMLSHYPAAQARAGELLGY